MILKMYFERGRRKLHLAWEMTRLFQASEAILNLKVGKENSPPKRSWLKMCTNK